VSCLGISEVIVTKFNQQQNNKSWQAADSAGKEIKELLDSKLSHIYRINILETYIVTLNGKLQPTEIEAFLASLYKGSQYMRNIGIAPNNQITHLYPLAGNEKALGLNYKDNLAQWPAVERVMQEHKAYLAGPLELVEGTSGIIYLVPVFLNDGTYWGVISTVLNTSDLISVVETKVNQTKLQVAIRNKEGKGADANSKVFYGDASLFNGDGVHINIPVTNGNWEMVVKPLGGVSALANSFRLMTVVLSLFLSLLTHQFLFSHRQSKRNKLIENDLKSSKVSLQSVLNSIPAEMAILNKDGVIIACNEAWLRFGINKPKLPGFPVLGAPVGTHYIQICKEADSGFMMDVQDKEFRQDCGICGVLEGKLIRFNKEYKRDDDGVISWYKIEATPIGDNKDNGVILMHSDISRRKQNEEDLRLSNSMKRAVLKSSPCAIMSVGPSGYFEDHNPATLVMFGCSKDELASKDTTWLDLLIPKRLHEDDCLKLIHYADNADDSSVNQPFESIGLRQNGQEFPIELTITPIHTEENNFYSLFIRDLTTFKQAEAALKQGLLEAEQANTVKSQFLAMMSHEIRTPLNAILGIQDLLVNTPLNVQQTEYMGIAAHAGTLLLRLVNDIMDLTKVESGKLDLEQLDFDAVPMVEVCMQLLAIKAQEKSLALHTIIEPDLNTWIKGDPYRFRQLILNLVSNAIKFTAQGSVTVKLSKASQTDDDCALLVEVIDTGIGIPEDLQAGLFEVFVQVDPSDTRKYGGSGLGLAISKRLVRLWGGQIGIDSTPSVGSRFWFTVGATVVAPEQPLLPTIKQDDSNRPNTFIARVLLVEDSLINQAVLAAMLRSVGHHVDLADCGTQGIEAASEKVYDIILMDVSMPDMSGMEATAIIRQLGGAAATVPIIAITAHALAGYEAMCLAAGMNGYTTKPISQKDLLALVDTWCANPETQTTAIINPLVVNSSALPLDEQEIHLDKAMLDELTAALGQAQVKELVQVFLTELATRCESIKQAIISQDLSILSREGHTIKSTSATFGATALQAVGKELEACGYNDDLATALLVAERLLPCAEATIKVLSLPS
jgi:PAS domain S-box-containing protein